MKKDVVVLITLLIVSIPAVRSLFIPGGFTSHDLTHHVVRQISMDRLLSEGQFPPRWSGDLNNGYGYPVFLFNYPLPAMVGQIFHKLGFGYVDSVKAVLFVSMVGSVLGMYLFLNALLKSRMAAFVGAIFYLYAPIRFLNVYVSAAVGSALALGILPFVFWAMVSMGNRGNKRNKGNWGILGGGIFLALLILAHNVTALIFAPVLLVFGWVILRLLRLRSVQVRSGQVGVMVLLGLGLSAWFWMPALIEAQYTRFDLIFGKFYADQFPSLWQLIRSPWGYGLSHPQNPEPGDMSYQIGLIHIGVMLVLSWWFVVRGWKIREVRVIGGFVLVFFTLSVFLMLKISLPFWENLPFLALIQFPLRFSALAVFSASISAALLIKHLPFKKFLAVTLVLLVIYANRNHWNINQVFDPGEDYYLQLKTTSTSFGEHLPRWGRIIDRASPAKFEFIRGMGDPSTGSTDSTSSPQAGSPQASSGQGIRVIRDQSAMVLAEVEIKDLSKLRLNQFYFPGWEIKIDGEKGDFNYLSDGESYGLLVFDTDKGKHSVEAEFKNTPVRNLADGISIISVIIVTFLTLVKKARF